MKFIKLTSVYNNARYLKVQQYLCSIINKCPLRTPELKYDYSKGIITGEGNPYVLYQDICGLCLSCACGAKHASIGHATPPHLWNSMCEII